MPTVTTTIPSSAFKSCAANCNPSCVRGFVRDRCRKCTLGSNNCPMCNHHPLSSPLQGQYHATKQDIQHRLQQVSCVSSSPPPQHQHPRLSSDSSSSSSHCSPTDSTVDLRTSSSSTNSYPRQGKKIKPHLVTSLSTSPVSPFSMTSPSHNLIPPSSELTRSQPVSPTIPTTGSTSFPAPPWQQQQQQQQQTSPHKQTTIANGASAGNNSSTLSPPLPPSCIFCFNGRQVCADCFGLGYVQRICQDCFKDQQQQKRRRQRHHRLQATLPSTSLLPVSISPSSAALPWSGLGSRLKEQRWLSGLSLSLSGLTSASSSAPNSATPASPTTVTAVMPRQPSPDSAATTPSNTRATTLSYSQQQQYGHDREGAGAVIWAGVDHQKRASISSTDSSSSSSSAGPGSQDEPENETEEQEADETEDDDSVRGGVGCGMGFPRAVRSSTWITPTSSSSFKSTVLKHLRAPVTLFRTSQDTTMTTSNATLTTISSKDGLDAHPSQSQHRRRRSEATAASCEKKKRWTITFTNLGRQSQSFLVPSTSSSSSSPQATTAAPGSGSRGRLLTAEREHEDDTEESRINSSNNNGERGHRRYWSLSAVSTNLLFGATSTAA